MMRTFIVIYITLVFAGCSMAVENLSTDEMERRDTVKFYAGLSRRFVSLRLIQKGMTQKEVQSVLNNKIVIGYEMSQPPSQQYRPITINNPFRTEVVKKGPNEYNVDYYLIGIKEQDDVIADDELFPLIFFKDKLIGQGWSYLNTKIKN